MRNVPRVWFYAGCPRARSGRSGRQAVQCTAAFAALVARADPFRHRQSDTAFSLEPKPASDSSLDSLQGDLRVMSDELAATFWLACDALAAQAR
jgi:hypothetical protein